MELLPEPEVIDGGRRNARGEVADRDGCAGWFGDDGQRSASIDQAIGFHFVPAVLLRSLLAGGLSGGGLPGRLLFGLPAGFLLGLGLLFRLAGGLRLGGSMLFGLGLLALRLSLLFGKLPVEEEGRG